MACVDCAKRRRALQDAIMHGKLAEAMDITVEGLRTIIGIDAKADHRKDPIAPVPISLSGKTKAELIEIAGSEGVTVEDGATNDAIRDAIEAKRAA